MFKNTRLRKKPVFMIIPMIDIIFFLLVFFMMSRLETVAQRAMAVQLPQAQTATVQKQIPVIMTLDKEGHIVVNDKTLDFEEARNEITREASQNPNLAVVLQADKSAVHGQVVAIMDMLKTAGVKKFSIAAQ